MKRGEVWYVRSTDSYGSEMALGRPALIVCSDYRVDRANHIQVLWCTTSPRSTASFRLCNMNDNQRDTYVLYSQIVTIDKRRFTTCIGEATPEEMSEINYRLKQMLGLVDDEEEDTPDKNEELEELRVEIENLKLELAVGNRMYEKALDKLAECRINEKLEPKVVVEEKREPEPEEPKKRGRKKKDVPDEVHVDVEALRRKMSEPNTDPEEEIKREMKKKIAGITGKVDVNRDDAETITAVTGMSLQTAHEIVKCRNKYGGYSKLEDLLVVPRFGTGCLKKYGDKLMV